MQLSTTARRNLKYTHRKKLSSLMGWKRVRPCRLSIECDLEEAGVKDPQGAPSLTADVSGTPLLSKVACQGLQPVNVSVRKSSYPGFIACALSCVIQIHV